MRHLITEYKGGLCSTKCGLRMISFFDCTVWWQDVTCPNCLAVIVPSRPKRRRLVKVPT